MEMGWSLRLEGRAASCQIGSTILWENHPLVLRDGPRMFHPNWFKLWWWLPAQLERRIKGSRKGWEAAAGRDGRLQQGRAAAQVAQPQLGRGRAPNQELSVPWLLPSRIVCCCCDSV